MNISLGKEQVCVIIHMQDIRKTFYPNLQGSVCRRHVGVPLTGTNMQAAANQQKHLFLSFPTYAKIHRLRNS